MKLTENRFLSGPRAGAATGGAEFAIARVSAPPVGAAILPPEPQTSHPPSATTNAHYEIMHV